MTPSSGGVTSLVTTGLNAGLAANTAVASYRAYTNATPGEHVLTVTATQSNGATVTADGNFEIVDLFAGTATVKNVIILLGDGMGTGHRSAARIVQEGIVMGKAKTPLAMDAFENTAMIKTSSLNSIVTDSAPGMQNYVTGNKAANNQEGVFPDDTAAAFDNPRVEYLSEFLHRTTGRSLGIVTTADVFDATPASMAAHTSNRGAGSGIVDQFFDDRATTGLKVLMGGGLHRSARGRRHLRRRGLPQVHHRSRRLSDDDESGLQDVDRLRCQRGSLRRLPRQRQASEG